MALLVVHSQTELTSATTQNEWVEAGSVVLVYIRDHRILYVALHEVVEEQVVCQYPRLANELQQLLQMTSGTIESCSSQTMSQYHCP